MTTATRAGLALIVAAMALYLVPVDGVGAAATTPVLSTFKCNTNVGGFYLGLTASGSATVSLDVPATITPGVPTNVGVVLAGGPTNGPIALDTTINAQAQATLDVTNATAPEGPAAGPVLGAAKAALTFPTLPVSVTANGAGPVTLKLNRVLTIAPYAGGYVLVYCYPDTPVTITIPLTPATSTSVGETTSTAGPTSSTSTSTTTASTTSTTSSTTSTSTTTTTAVPGITSTQVTKQSTATYSCAVLVGGVAVSAPLTSEVTAVVTAPDKVGPGQVFDVGFSFAPGPRNGPIGFNAGAVTYSLGVDVAGAGAPTSRTTQTRTNPAAIGASTLPDGPYETYPVPVLPLTITAPTTVGAQITTTPNQLVLDIPSLNGVSTCTRTSTLASMSSTVVVAGSVVQGSTTTTSAAPTTTSTTLATGPTTPSTIPSAPSASAKVITKSAQLDYTCDIEVSGSKLTPQTSTVTALVSGPDIVSPGSSYQVSVAFDPGPKNGPIRFAAGLVSYQAQLSVTGGSPTSVTTNSVKNPDVVAASKLPDGPNVYHRVPSLTATITAPSTAGSTVGIAPTKLIISVPSQSSTTTCVAASSAALLTTNVVAGALDNSAVLAATAARGGSGLAVTGSDSSLTTLIAALLLIAGVVLLGFGQWSGRLRSRLG